MHWVLDRYFRAHKPVLTIWNRLFSLTLEFSRNTQSWQLGIFVKLLMEINWKVLRTESISMQIGIYQGAFNWYWNNWFIDLTYFQKIGDTKMPTLPTLCITGKLHSCHFIHFGWRISSEAISQVTRSFVSCRIIITRLIVNPINQTEINWRWNIMSKLHHTRRQILSWVRKRKLFFNYTIDI